MLQAVDWIHWNETVPKALNQICASRRRRASSGRPKTKRRRRRSPLARRRTTTWSFAECAKTEESCFAVTPARPPTTSTAWTHPSRRYPTGSGCVRGAWWAHTLPRGVSVFSRLPCCTRNNVKLPTGAARFGEKAWAWLVTSTVSG